MGTYVTCGCSSIFHAITPHDSPISPFPEVVDEVILGCRALHAALKPLHNIQEELLLPACDDQSDYLPDAGEVAGRRLEKPNPQEVATERLQGTAVVRHRLYHLAELGIGSVARLQAQAGQRLRCELGQIRIQLSHVGDTPDNSHLEVSRGALTAIDPVLCGWLVYGPPKHYAGPVGQYGNLARLYTLLLLAELSPYVVLERSLELLRARACTPQPLVLQPELLDPHGHFPELD